MCEKKMVVLFPGSNYSTECPLLYYAGFKYEVKGYEKVDISFENLLNQNKSIDERVEDIKKAAMKQLQNFDLSKYDDVVFVSKSLGTVIAGCIEDKLGIRVRHIYLTPIIQTLPYITKKKNIITVVAGTRDKELDADTLKAHCAKENVCLKQIEGAGHRLEVWSDMNKNIEILREIVELY